MELNNKKILVISPSKWGDIYISKHHYSIELANLGNEIYYLEPATNKNPRGFSVWSPIEKLPNLKIIRFHLPKWLTLMRFKIRYIFDFIMSIIIFRFLKKVKIKFDIVWCFETNLYKNLRNFGANYVIFHPVDLLVYPFQCEVARSANIVFFVSDTIRNQLAYYHTNKHFIQHGIGREFEEAACRTLSDLKFGKTGNSNKKLKIGFVGNLFRQELNYDFLVQAVEKHQNVSFHFWGPLNPNDSNVDGITNNRLIENLNNLKIADNTIFHGVAKGAALAEAIKDMDVFLLCFNVSETFDVSNSHKILEYLSVGKVIVSSHVNYYQDKDLFVMANDDKTDSLLLILDQVVNNIEFYNSTENQIKRVQYALDNTYNKQIMRIEYLINNSI